MRTAVCDDEKEQAAEIAGYIRGYPVPCTVRLYGSAADLLEDYRTGVRHDLIFLDIRMDGLDGFSAASLLRTEFPDNPPLIVFLTVTSEYAVRGYGLAWRYIQKPASGEDIRRTLEQAYAEIEKHSIFVETTDGLLQIGIDDIICVEAYYGTVRIYTPNGIVSVKSKYSRISGMLPETRFFGLHRSYTVNFSHIGWFGEDKNEVTLVGGKQIPLSRRKRQAFLAAFENFLRTDRHARA
jgi:DNA-binding LytR/AlgR family response regulator